MFLDTIFGPEKRAQTSGLKNPASWLVDLLAPIKNHSGVSVNETTAMQLTAVGAAVNVISSTIAAQKCNPHQKIKEKIIVADAHPTYRLLTLRPNPFMSAFTFFQAWVSHALRWGNGCAHIVFDNRGFPVELWPFPNPDSTTLVRMDDGSLVYRTTIEGEIFNYASDSVLHLKALGRSGLWGVSPIRQHAEELGIQIAAQNFGAEFFGNGAVIQGVLEHPGNPNEEARAAIRESWAKALSGQGNRHKTPVLPDGMQYKHIGVPPEEAQFLETRQYGDTKIAQIYNVPPHMIGDLSKATFSNITEETMNFVRRTINPWFIQAEQEKNYKLFSTKEQKKYFVKYDKSDILKGPPKEEAEKDVSLVNGGVITRNEARANRGLNPIEGLDEILVPLNMVELSKVSEMQQSNQPAEQNNIDPDPLIKRFAEILLRAETKVKKDGVIEKWVSKNARPFIERHLKPIAESIGFPEIVDQFSDEYITAVGSRSELIGDHKMIERTLGQYLINIEGASSGN